MTTGRSISFDVGFGTDRGRNRSRNEDSLFVDMERGLFIVADGMGGHRAGEVASRVAVETISEHFHSVPLPRKPSKIEQDMKEALQRANEEIFNRSYLLDDLRGMGTTVVVALIYSEKIYLAHAGDSRAYLLRQGNLQQLTEDHSVTSRMVREGNLTREEAKDHHLHSALYRALGQDVTLEVDTNTYDYQAGDTLILCSDGLTDMIEDDEIMDVLYTFASPQQACDQLISRANTKGGRDNITVIIVQFGAE